MTFISADRFLVGPNRHIEELEGGARRSIAGEKGFVFYGPYLDVMAGIYSIKLDMTMESEESFGYWDVYNAGQIYGWRYMTSSSKMFVHLDQTNALEIRFNPEGSQFVLKGVTLIPVLLEHEDLTLAEIRHLGDPEVLRDATSNMAARLAQRLGGAGFPTLSAEIRARYITSCTGPKAELDRMFLALNAPGLIELEVEKPSSVERDEIERFVSQQHFTSFDLFNLGPEQSAQLQRMGYQPQHLQMTRLHEEDHEPTLRWQRPPHGGPTFYHDQGSSFFEALASVDLSFQTSLARGEGMTAFCPTTGRLLKSFHGFCVYHGALPFCIYRFDGQEAFYVCTGGFPNSRLFIYMPRTGSIILTFPPNLRFYSNEDIIRQMNLNMMSIYAEVVEYLKAPAHPAAALNRANLGHFFWNDLGGLHRLIDCGLSPRLAEIIQLENPFIDVHAIFPELTHIPVTTVGSDEAAFNYCVRNHLLPIRFTQCVIEDSFGERIRDGAQRRVTAAGVPPHDAPSPLILINLRAHSKVWLDQASGYAHILNALYDEYGQAGALIDGWTDCSEIAADIRAQTRPEVKLYDGLGLSIYDTLNWAFNVDGYITVIGSGLVLVNWLANRPGVAHAERNHMGQLSWWNQVRPTATAPLVPAISDIEDVGAGAYCNYKIDWRVLLSLLQQALRQEAK